MVQKFDLSVMQFSHPNEDGFYMFQMSYQSGVSHSFAQPLRGNSVVM